MDDGAYDRAWQVQEILTRRGQHRSARAVDIAVAATAELQGLALLMSAALGLVIGGLRWRR
ncbi:hypothetical protein SGFS_063710 [Streptomyces graminofaciens]|uniref:Uncharacterized protein n=1 Tax=Streptomyces graminofaciens TaxID=68212 RepID=A0ABM7FDF8_9ACTN|nr:hypothetical protein SGFS_063710 [Streptomyces graminofaciens]